MDNHTIKANKKYSSSCVCSYLVGLAAVCQKFKRTKGNVGPVLLLRYHLDPDTTVIITTMVEGNSSFPVVCRPPNINFKILKM